MCEPKFQNPTTSNGGDYPGQPQIGPFLTLRFMAAPVQNANFENLCFFHVRNGQHIVIEPNFDDPTTSYGGFYLTDSYSGYNP